MQLDRTRIAVSERAMVEILDLALQTVRAYWRPLPVLLALGVAPAMLINYLLIGWMADVNYTELHSMRLTGGLLDSDDFWQVVRYLWDMLLLVFIEAPLFTVLITAYLGQAVFMQQPRLRNLLADVARLFPRLLLCQGVYRGVLLAWLLLLVLDRNQSFSFVEAMLMMLALYCAAVRAARPFLNEVILLERNPVRAKVRGAMTIGRRSSLLHNPSATSDLILRWMGSCLAAALLVAMIFCGIWWVPGQLLEDWSITLWYTQLIIPLSMWVVAGYFAVVRYLAYLDLRIRQEGWEVELKLRAEAARMASKLT